MLACRRFKGHHTTDNIVAQFEEIVSNFEITTKVTHVNTENVSSMAKAFKLPGYDN